MLLASLTIGSISPITASEAGHGSVAFCAPHIEFFGAPGVQVFNGAVDKGYTTVILEMSDNPGTVSDQALFMAYHTADMVKYNENSFIRGKMIVQRPGENDRSFPVQWARHTPPMFIDGQEFASFEANMSIPMSSITTPGVGLPPMEAFLFFHSKIDIAHPVVSGSLPAAQALANHSYNDQIGAGQTVWHTADITGSSTTLSVDLKWQNANDDLRLMIYTPDGHVLGPYYDNSDNASDGQINLNVSNPGGVATGTWSFKVTGVTVSGKDDYYLRTW